MNIESLDFPKTKLDEETLINWWHLSKCALSGEENYGRNARLNWVAKEWNKVHPEEGMKAYIWLNNQTAGY